MLSPQIIDEERIFHIGYLQSIRKILSCVCLNCSKLLIEKNEKEIDEIIKTKTPKERFAYVRASVKNTSCCGIKNSKIRCDIKKGEVNIIAELDTNSEILTAEMVYKILKNISDQDYRILGIDRDCPEYAIHKVVFVPPIKMHLLKTTP